MSQIKQLPKFGEGAPNIHIYDLHFTIVMLDTLVEAEQNKMKGKGYAGSRSRRLELGQKALDLLNLMYGWEKQNEESK